jgi:hypothetical protein
MPEYPLELATRQLRRTFERAIGKSIAKILTELVTNSDDSYKRLVRYGEKNGEQTVLEDPTPIIILFERTKKRLSVIDHAEGLSDKEMRDRFVSYGEESTDRVKGYKTRSLFGKGLRDVLFTQKHGQVKSIKNGLFYNCRFRWKDASGRERPVIDIKPPSRVTPELRAALRIPANGTLVEFVLRDDVPKPQIDKLASILGQFYMLRMINSSPHREVMLIAVGRRGNETRQLNYQFPEIEIKDQFKLPMITDLGTDISIEAEIGTTDEELSQGEAAYTDREGGLLVLDEDDAVLDLQLFGFDDDPAARRISGTVKLMGAGEYIRRKLNQSDPEEVLTETRDGFSREHPFYRQLREILHRRLEPIVAKLRELGPKPKVTLSEKTRERHQEAIDILNRLASQMLGITARVPVLPAHKRVPPDNGIAFVNNHISVQTRLATPAVLLINPNIVGPNDIINVSSNLADIVAEPTVFMRGEDDDAGVIIKIVRIRSEIADLTGKVTARWRDVQVELDVSTTAREVLTPVNGLEFDRDEYNVRVDAGRHLRLFLDVEKIPLGSEISIIIEGTELEISKPRITVGQRDLITPKVAQLEILVRGVRPKREIMVTAAHAEYTAGTSVTVVKREKPDRGKQGLFRGYRFQPLERKVQTQWLPEGYILINTKDPVNARYFGNDPGTAVEERAYCQVRLADLILNECLQIMVSQALDAGRLDRRFPNNPEIDVRNYVDEQKFEIGVTIHEKFVTKVTSGA